MSANGEVVSSDLLDRAILFPAFTQIVTHSDAPRVVSIESGYGVGKTTFARLWGQHLRDRGVTVVHFDAWSTDRAADPLIAFMTELARACPPPKDGDKKDPIKSIGKPLLTVLRAGGRAIGKAALREGFDDLTDGLSDAAGEAFGDKTAELLEQADKKLDDVLTQEAVGQLVEQIAVAEVRERSLETQLDTIRTVLSGKEDGRVVVIIDELDRCRPDYAISLLEALKHLFDHRGYVFVLMISPDRLENTAGAMFGSPAKGESYLTKFIDLRMKLGVGDVAQLALRRFKNLPPHTPWCPLPKSAEIAISEEQILANFVIKSGVHARQIVRAFTAVKVALMLYANKPADAMTLVLLAISSSQTPSVRADLGSPSYTFAIDNDPRLQIFTEYEIFKRASEGRSNEGDRELMDIFRASNRLARPAERSSTFAELTGEPATSGTASRSAFLRYHIDILEASSKLVRDADTS